MKYKYDTKERLIENYEIKGKEVILYFLDGSAARMDLSTKNLEGIKKIMYNQMNNKIEYSKTHDLEKRKYFNLAVISANSYFILSEFMKNYIQTNEKPSYGITFLYALCLSLYLKDYLNDKNSKKEVEKFKLYLELEERLKYINYNLLGIKEDIDVNTINNLSLKDMKKINDKVYTLRKMYGNPHDYTINIQKKETTR